MSGAHHIQIEVDAVAARSGAVMDGVDEIGAAFERLDDETSPAEGAEEAQCKSGLTGAAIWGCDEELGDHQPQIYYVCTGFSQPAWNQPLNISPRRMLPCYRRSFCTGGMCGGIVLLTSR